MVAALAALYIAALWVTLIFWTYRDIRQRTRDPIVQSVAVLLVLFFFLPGLWLYLILRPRHTLADLYERSLEEEALLQELEDQKSCPNCKRRVHDDYLICPSCRNQLKEPCRSCSKPLSYAWLACPYCGLEKPPREAPRARPRPAPGVPHREPAVARAATKQPVKTPEGNARPQQRPETRPDPFVVTRARPADEAPMIDATAFD
jgi:RNA polymerase subunit RPABC4/transcription elongation factor Spt4